MAEGLLFVDHRSPHLRPEVCRIYSRHDMTRSRNSNTLAEVVVVSVVTEDVVVSIMVETVASDLVVDNAKLEVGFVIEEEVHIDTIPLD